MRPNGHTQLGPWRAADLGAYVSVLADGADRLEPKSAPRKGGAPEGRGVPGGNPAGRRIESRRDRMSRRDDPQNSTARREPRSGAEDRGARLWPSCFRLEVVALPSEMSLFELPQAFFKGARIRTDSIMCVVTSTISTA